MKVCTGLSTFQCLLAGFVELSESDAAGTYSVGFAHFGKEKK